MRLGVTSKLFFAFLVTNVAIALVVAAAAQIAVKTGFRNYVNEREEQRLSNLSEALVGRSRRAEARPNVGAHDAGLRESVRPVAAVAGVRPRGLGWNYRTGQRLERRRHHRRSADRLQRAATGHQHVTAAQERERCPQSGVGIREDGKFLNIGHSISPRMRSSSTSTHLAPVIATKV
jgi:hypothetical protein